MKRTAALLIGLAVTFSLATPAEAWPADTVFSSHACEEFGPAATSAFICLDTLHYRHNTTMVTLATEVEIGCKNNGVIVQCHGVSSINHGWISRIGSQPSHTMICGTFGGPICSATRNYDLSIPRAAVGSGYWTWESIATNVKVYFAAFTQLEPGTFEGPFSAITVT